MKGDLIYMYRKFLPKSIREQIDPDFRKEEQQKEINNRINQLIIKLSFSVFSKFDNEDLTKIRKELAGYQYINIAEKRETVEEIFNCVKKAIQILKDIDNNKTKYYIHSAFNIYRGYFPQYAQELMKRTRI